MAALLLVHPGIAYGISPVIYQVQTGGTTAVGTASAASQEFISVYNNSDLPIDVTNWCIRYSSARNATQTELECLVPPDIQTHIMLSPRSEFIFATSQFLAVHTGFMPDGIFASGLSGQSGHVLLIDNLNTEKDRIGWGAAVQPEAQSAAPHSAGKILQRLLLPGSLNMLQDTGNNSLDFMDASLISLGSSGLYEEVVEVDMCPNIVNLQTSLPSGFLQDENGDCHQDICANIDGLQTEIPEEHESMDGENCSPIVPESAVLLITELLPNVEGSDTGKEFIEIYNPNSRFISLKNYVLQLGPSYSKSYPLPADKNIAPNSFLALFYTETHLTLPNTFADLRLIAPDSSVVSSANTYQSPKENMSWVLIEGVWQFTNQPTPNNSNLKTAITDEDIETSDLIPCRSDQERNPETNRCRNAAQTTSTLVPCGEGQERNPETNRCRKAAASGNVQGVAAVKDLPAGSVGENPRWLLAILAVTAAFGYAAFEWRQEVMIFLSKIKNKLVTR